VNLARIAFAGRLSRDIETRFGSDGKPIVTFGVVCDTGYGDKKKPLFIDVVFFGKRGEAFAKFHKKGDDCYIEGELQLDQWEDKQTGQKRSKHKIVGNEWQFIGSKKDRAAEQATGPSAPIYAAEDDGTIPF